MTVTWVNKAGADRGRTDLVREEGITSMNFQGTGSFEGLTADEIKELLDRTPGLVPEVGEKTPGKVRSWRHQIVSFRDDMEVDDRILTPFLETRASPSGSSSAPTSTSGSSMKRVPPIRAA